MFFYPDKVCIVIRGHFISLSGILIQIVEFNFQNRRLQGIEPAVYPNNVVMILFLLTVIGDHSNLFRQHRIVV